MEKMKIGIKLLCMMVDNTHNSLKAVSNIVWRYLLLKIWEIYEEYSNWVNFWATKVLPFLNGSEFQGASPAPMCIVQHQTLTKTPTRWSVTSEPSVPSILYDIEIKTVGLYNYWLGLAALPVRSTDMKPLQIFQNKTRLKLKVFSLERL